MSDATPKERQALFWYALIAPLLDPTISSKERRDHIKRVLEKDHAIPDSSRRRISRATLFRKLAEYRRAGFGGLKKPDRADKGASRTIKPDWLNKAIELRLEQPGRTTRRLIELTEKALGLAPDTIKLKTLARFLKAKSVTRADLADEKQIGFTRFAHHNINELWMSDVMDGFPIPDPADERRRKMTYLISVIDDASRLVPFGQFYFDEKLPRLENTLKKGIARRGIPHAIYVDNGRIYHATQFELICAELDMRIFHSEAYSPEGRGKIERWHYTLQTDFLSEARAKGPRSLAELNAWFWAWLEMAYHHKIHESLGITPIAFWMRQTDKIRHADPAVLDSVFLWREERHVSAVHTFTVAGNLYEVVPELATKTIEVRFNPCDLTAVHVYRDGAFLTRARPCSVPQPVHPKAPKPPPRVQKPLSMSYIDTLVEQYNKHVEQEFGTLDFRAIEEKRKLALEDDKGKFVAAIAAHLDRSLSSIEVAASRGLFDDLAPIDPAVVAMLPKNPVPDAVAFGKFLSGLRSLVLERRQPKGGR